jgi:hypothetical protein
MTDYANKRSRSAWTLENKICLLDRKDEAEKRGQKRTALDLGAALAVHVNSKRRDDQVPIKAPGKASVNEWIQNEQSLKKQATEFDNHRRRAKKSQHQKMEEALFIWFKQMSDRELAITDEMLVEIANEIGKLTNVPEGFKFSSGWLYNWKKQHGVRVDMGRRRHGEAAAADQAGVLLARESVRKVVEGYGEEKMYNQDESGLFWRQVPTRTLAQGKKAGLKKDKQRITVSFTCNATGTDKQLLL